MMNVSEKIDRYDSIVKKLKGMQSEIIEERRRPTSAELAVVRPLLDEVEELEPDIKGHVAMQQAEDQRKYWGASQRPRTLVGPVGSTSCSTPRMVFRSFGEQLQAIRNAGTPGGEINPKLYEVRATGMGENISSDGGFLVQTDYASEIFAPVWNANPVLSKTTRFSISGNANGMKINALSESARTSGSGNRHGGVLGYWLDEAALKQASKPKFRQMELSLKKLVVLCYVTDEMLQDSSVLAQFISTTARNEIQFLLLDAVLAGVGAGQPLGILNSGCLVTVDKESGQKSGTVIAENIFSMWSRLHETNPDSTVWLVNRSVLPQLFQMSIGIGTSGSAVYLPANISGSPYSTLFGRPVIICEQCPTLGTAGDIMLCDMSQYCVIDKGSIQEDWSIHIMYLYDESVYRAVFRADGQPLWSTAVTPFKGSATVSPFVCLQSRT